VVELAIEPEPGARHEQGQELAPTSQLMKKFPLKEFLSQLVCCFEHQVIYFPHKAM
jgi:hypothetical protein